MTTAPYAEHPAEVVRLNVTGVAQLTNHTEARVDKVHNLTNGTSTRIGFMEAVVAKLPKNGTDVLAAFDKKLESIAPELGMSNFDAGDINEALDEMTENIKKHKEMYENLDKTISTMEKLYDSKNFTQFTHDTIVSETQRLLIKMEDEWGAIIDKKARAMEAEATAEQETRRAQLRAIDSGALSNPAR